MHFRIIRNITLLIAAIMLGGCVSEGYQSSSLFEWSGSKEVKFKGEYIVTIVSPVTITEVLSMLQKYKPEVSKELAVGRYLVTVSPDPGLADLKNLLTPLSGNAQIQPNQ